MKTVTIQQKEVYGEVKFYPLCANGKIFAELAKTKTLTTEALRLIKSLGYQIDVQHQKVNF
jgi:hypothetical protein